MKIHGAGLRIAGATLLAPMAWGTTYLIVTEMLPAGRPLLVASARVLPAGVVLVVLGSLRSGWRPQSGIWLHTAVLAMFNFGIFFPLLTVATYRLPGGIAAASSGLQPLLVAGFSWIIAGRRPRAVELTVGWVAAVGVCLVMLRPGFAFDWIGVFAVVGANASFALGVVLTRLFATPASPLAATGWQLLVGGLILLPLTLALEGMPPSLTGRNATGFAYLSFVGTGAAFALWFNGIRRLPPAAPPLLGLAVPMTAAVLGWVILKQSLSLLQLAGFVMTFTAIGYGASLGASAPDSEPRTTRR